MGRHGIEEVTVVAHHEDGALRLGEVVLEPRDGL